MPEHKFIVYSIGAEEKYRGKFNYTIPDNVIEVKEIFLDSALKDKSFIRKNYTLTDSEKNTIENIITGEKLDFKNLYNFLKNKCKNHILDFFMSRAFFNIAASAYEKKYSHIPFTKFFWNIRSMLLPLFYIVNIHIPEADLYHSVSNGYSGIIGSLASSLYNKPFIITEHGIYTREREEEIIKSKWLSEYMKDIWIDFFCNIAKYSYDHAAKVITLFNKNKEIEMELGCAEEKIEIIQNGIDVKGFSYIKTRKEDDFINIASILRVVPIKDVKTMLESFLIVSYEIKNCNFYIIGPTDEDDKYYKECLKFADELKLKNVFFTGKVNVKDYMERIDIIVLSSISEGQPLALLEGMACKKPIVATNVGNCSELIYGIDDNYGDSGILVPVMNHVKMGNALIKLCRDKKLREEMGNNGFKRVSHYYTLEKFINSYKNIYEKYRLVQ